jgi:hypothetical protein
MVDRKLSLMVAHAVAYLLRIETAQRVKAGPSVSGRHRVAHYGAASQITQGNLRLANGPVHSPGIVPQLFGVRKRLHFVQCAAQQRGPRDRLSPVSSISDPPLSSGLSCRLRFVAHPKNEENVCHERCVKFHEPTPTSSQHIRTNGRSTQWPLQGITHSLFSLTSQSSPYLHQIQRFALLSLACLSHDALVLETGGY